MKVLLRANMSAGNYATDFHSDTNAQIYSFTWAGGDLPDPENIDGEYISSSDDAIIVNLNRY